MREHAKENYKLYSLQSIIFGGFFASPIVSGYLMYSNFKTINEPDKARNVLVISILFTILFFVGIFQIPEDIIDRIPKFAFSLFNSAVIYLYAKRAQGDILEKHKADEKDFHSGGRVFVVSLAVAVVLAGTVFATIYLSVPKEYDLYDEEMALFYFNEEKALDAYNQLDGMAINDIVSTINQSIIPKWEKNIEVLKDVRRMNNFPEDLIRENELLMQYSQLRIESLEAVKKSVMFDNEIYRKEVEAVYRKIDSVIGVLNTP